MMVTGSRASSELIFQNQVREGSLAVVFKGPPAIACRSIDTGFEGGITRAGTFLPSDQHSAVPWWRRCPLQ
jgi:hypothetical protein